MSMECDKASDDIHITTTPVAIHFSSKVKLMLHDAFLPTAGLLQCEPVATVFVVTMQSANVYSNNNNNNNNNCTTRSTTTKGQGKKEQSMFSISALHSVGDLHESNPEPNKYNNSSDDDYSERTCNCILSCKQVAQSKVRYFTSRPTYNETLEFDVEESPELTTFASAFANMHLLLNPQNNNNITDNNYQHTSCKANESNELFARSISDGLIIVFEDVHKEHFYGAAYCPFSLHVNSNTLECPTSVMLLARNAFSCGDALYMQDIQRLKELELATYGYVNISWEVNLIPRGGIVVSSSSSPTTIHNNVETCTPTFPVGLAIRAQWMYPTLQHLSEEEEYSQEMKKKVKFTVAVEFGEDGTDRFVVAPHQPLCFTLRANPTSDVLTFHCTMTRSLCIDNSDNKKDALMYHSLNQQNSGIVGGNALLEKDANQEENVETLSTKVHLLSLSHTSSYDRDVRYTCPLRTSTGVSLGVLNVLLRLSHNSLQGVNDKTNLCPNNGHCAEINNPLHQLEYTHSVNDGVHVGEGIGAMPLAPHSSYQEVYWESENHERMAVERHYRYKCIHEACPTAEHVRHVFDVLLKKVELDHNVAHVAGLFCKCSEEELTLHELKQFMVGLAFHAKHVSAFQAARFCFFALRHDVEDAIAIHEVEYILQHCLLSHTLDLPESEIRRFVRDIFGPTATQVTYKEFTEHLLFNYGLWSALGVPLCVDHRTLITVTPTNLFKTWQHWKQSIIDHVGCEENTINKPMVILQLSDVIEEAQNKQIGIPYLAKPDDNTTKINNNNNRTLALPCVLPSAPTLASNLPCETSTRNSITNNKFNSMKEQTEQIQQERSTFSKAENEMANLSDPQIWRSFVVRLVSNKKGYSVTAHVNDTIQDVMKMIEETIHLPANKQEWRIDNSNSNTYLDPKVKIGSTILGLPPAIKHKRNVSATTIAGPSSSSSFASTRSFRPTQQTQHNANELPCTSRQTSSTTEMSSATRSSFNTVWIRETEEMIELNFVCKDRHKRWQERFAVNEKILRVRAAVQRVTLIPLSRCVLRLRRKVQIDREQEKEQQTLYNTGTNETPSSCEIISIMLADRHRIAYYHFEPDDVIEVYQG